MEVAIELDDSLESEAGSSVCWCTVFESVDVILDCVLRYVEMSSPLGKHFRAVDSLGARRDLFSSHKEVITVGIIWIFWVQHSVKWSCIRRIAIKHVEISFVLLFDKSAQFLFSIGTQILKILLFNSSCSEHLDAIFEMKSHNRVLAYEIFKWILLFDDF